MTFRLVSLALYTRYQQQHTIATLMCIPLPRVDYKDSVYVVLIRLEEKGHEEYEVEEEFST